MCVWVHKGLIHFYGIAFTMAGLFSFIESFFFLSIGITFILILLLVYHFKQRLTLLEQKTETIVSIVNQLTHEITYMKPMMSHSGGRPKEDMGTDRFSGMLHGGDPAANIFFVSHPQPDYIPPEVPSGAIDSYQCPIDRQPQNEAIASRSLYQVEEIDEEDEEEEEDDDEEEEDEEDDVMYTGEDVEPEELPLDEVLEFEPPVPVPAPAPMPSVSDEDMTQPPEITLHSDSSSKHSKISIYELRAMAVKKGLITINESTKLKKAELQRMLDQYP